MKPLSLPIQLGLIVFGLFFSASALYIWYENSGPGYHSELNTIREDLGKIERIERFELDWRVDDDFPLLSEIENIRATIQVEGKGEMVFSGLSRQSARDSRHLHLESVGPYRIRMRGKGYQGVYKAATGEPVRSEFGGGNPDVGPDGAFAHLFPFPLPNIQAALEHHDEILRIFEDLSESSTTPRHFTDSEGTDYYFWVVIDDLDSSVDPLWNQPLSSLEGIAIPSRSDRKEAFQGSSSSSSNR